MNTTIFCLLMALALPAAAADADCARSSDACSGGKKLSSPFAEASLLQGLPQPAPGPKAAAAPEAGAAPAPKAAPAPAAPEVSPAPPAAGPAAPAQAPRPLSSPLWLLFVGGSLAGLYYYLVPRRRGRKK